MTVAATPRKAGPYAGNGVATSFPFAFKVFVASDIQPVLTDSSGAATNLVLDSDYSVLLNADQDANPGGTVTYPILVGPAPMPAGSTLTIIGNMSFDQLTDITDTGRFLPQVFENAYDKLTILLQQLKEVSDRTLQAAVGTTVKLLFPAPSSGKFIRWRTDLAGLENVDAGTDSIALQGLLGDNTAGGRGAGMIGMGTAVVYPAGTVGGLIAGIDSKTDPARGASLVGYKINAVGANGRTVYDRLGDEISVKDFGATGDGTTDDTVSLQAAITAAQTLKRSLLIPGGTYKVTAPLVVSGTGLRITGDSTFTTVLKATGNFASIFSITGTATYNTFQNLSIDTSGTTTPCAKLAVNSVVTRFTGCYFVGNLSGGLVYSNGQNLDFDKCTWQVNNAATFGIDLDCYNQNTGITDCRFGGIGRGVRVSNSLTPGSNRVEGLRIVGTYFVNTGTSNVEIGNSLFTTISGCVLDQANTHSLDISSSADVVVVDGCYLGTSAVTTAVCVAIASSAGGGHTFSNNVFGFAGYGITIDATGSVRVNNVNIDGNVFISVVTPLQLDSVNRCNLTGNIDTNVSVNGSWTTKGTYPSGGVYLFSNNSWYTTAPALFHSGSSYRFDNEIGIVGRNRGATVTPGAATTLVISHGLFRTPSKITVTPEGTSGAFSIASLTSTTFTVVWATSGTPKWHWDAEV